MRIAIAALLLATFACGGSDLDSAMNGTWSGPGTVTISGNAPLSFDGQVRIAVSGRTATLSGPCLDRSGSIALEGTGTSASWQGSYACPALQFSNCASVTLTRGAPKRGCAAGAALFSLATSCSERSSAWLK